MLFASALFLPSAVAAQAADAKPDTGTNAAVKYWQAFALLPPLDKDQEKLLQEWNKVPLDAAALNVINRSQTCLTAFHRAARLPHCDWGLDYADGIRMWVPHAPKALALARLAALHARYEFEQGHGKAGWEDVTAVLKLARDVEKDRLMIIQMIGYRIEATAIEAATPYLPELKPVLTESEVAVVDALPARPTLPQMLLAEKQMGPVWLIQELKEAEQRKEGSWRGILKELFDHPESEDRNLVQSVKSFDQAVRMLQDTLPLYDQLAKIVTFPRKEAEARYPEFIKEARDANPMAHAVFPAVDRVIAAEQRSRAQMALFKAALAVVRGGPDQLKEIKDPFGDGPFEYRAQDAGFELKSKLLFKGRPVTLVVGRAKRGT
jgi:hypothetical protein